ncbi:hypothetical protein EDD16DRAFT_69370 [Pisolithus croceorrhizus]|nr:hypothetical protein EDD16DRAFT_69370 [Pisolithus croceorrhizus]KAI6149097.1 hypothetical protein EDD17DRAFT_1209890 [Pisolithus thermaeus]
MYSRAPALKCLQLDGLDESSSAASLTTDYLSSNSLTRLSLVGTASWRIPRDSIHFPVLESLALGINGPISFLEAIVVPKLKHFDFSEGYNERPVCGTFCGLTSKFDNVHHLVFSPPITESLSQKALDLAMDIFQVFRGVCHTNIHIKYLFPFFYAFRMMDRPDHHPSPIGNWTHLESLEIQGITSIEAGSSDSFMDWLMKRRNFWATEIAFETHSRRHHLRLSGSPECSPNIAGILHISGVVSHSTASSNVSLYVCRFTVVGEWLILPV